MPGRITALTPAAAGMLAGLAWAGDLWRFAHGEDPYAGTDGCLLVSAALSMPDGYHGAEVRLVFGAEALTVVTDSNIDPSYPGQGIAVDGGERIWPDEPFPFARRNAVFKLDRDALVERFRRGGTAELALGFWPTWPVTATQRVAISLSGFTEAHEEYLACRDGRGDDSP